MLPVCFWWKKPVVRFLIGMGTHLIPLKEVRLSERMEPSIKNCSVCCRRLVLQQIIKQPPPSVRKLMREVVVYYRVFERAIDAFAWYNFVLEASQLAIARTGVWLRSDEVSFQE